MLMNAVGNFLSDDLYTFFSFFFTGRYQVHVKGNGWYRWCTQIYWYLHTRFATLNFPQPVPSAERKNQQVPIDYEISIANFRRATCKHFFLYTRQYRFFAPENLPQNWAAGFCQVYCPNLGTYVPGQGHASWNHGAIMNNTSALQMAFIKCEHRSNSYLS